MSNETSKATLRRRRAGTWDHIFRGSVIDIGCGPDPLRVEDWPDITRLVTFDKEQGDANKIDEAFAPAEFDCVHSSQLLEHLFNPYDALVRFLRITKPGGYVIATVPDFDIYEKGIFPSVHNSDHKSTWSLWRYSAPTSFPHVWVPELGARLNNVSVSAGLCANGIDWMRPDKDHTLGAAEAFIEIIIRKNP